MNTAVTTPQTFEQKMSAKIKDGIGDLLSDEDLKKLIDRSMEEVFFKPRTNPKRGTSYHSSEPDTIPPLLHSLIQELLLPQMNILLKEYLENNKEQVMALMKDVVTDGIGNAVIKAMNSQFQLQLLNFQNNVQNQLNNRG